MSAAGRKIFTFLWLKKACMHAHTSHTLDEDREVETSSYRAVWFLPLTTSWPDFDTTTLVLYHSKSVAVERPRVTLPARYSLQDRATSAGNLEVVLNHISFSPSQRWMACFLPAGTAYAIHELAGECRCSGNSGRFGPSKSTVLV